MKIVIKHRGNNNKILSINKDTHIWQYHYYPYPSVYSHTFTAIRFQGKRKDDIYVSTEYNQENKDNIFISI